MSYRIDISFPIVPTEKDIKKLKRDIAHSKFDVVDGGKAEKKPNKVNKETEKR